MVIEFAGIFAGFIKNLIDNSKWLNNLINEKIYIKLFKFHIRKIKDIPEDNLEFAYKILAFKEKMRMVTLMYLSVIYFIIVVTSTLIIIMLLNMYIPPLKIYNTIIPQWVLFLIGYFIGFIYKLIFRKI
jgi:hypothetical protein